ncbi:MAG: hypothetical protein OXG04_09615 [Acidobacteria bacterium]|nr:hypothetical protein [Acidobacteriota bacterium]
MSMTLMHIEHHPIDFTVPTSTYREIAELADAAIRNDETLEQTYRNDPARINVLRDVLDDTEGPFTTDREAVERFADVLESESFRNIAGDNLAELTTLACKLAGDLRTLATEHDTLHLTLL